MTSIRSQLSRGAAHDENGGAASPSVQADQAPRLATPVDPRSEHELLRLAAGMAPYLNSPTGQRLTDALAARDVTPALVERIVASAKDSGVIAIIEGALYALGRPTFVADIGVSPHQAELRVAERIQRAGATPFLVVAVARTHCLGVLAAPGASTSASTP